MKIHEILVESQLQEGPILNKIGSAIGKGAGTLAKGVGAVAGGIAGLGGAIKKGFQAGKATVGGAGDDEPAAGGSAPAANPTTEPAAGGSAPAGAAAPAAKKAPAAGGSAPTANPKADTAYAQAQKAIASLQPEQKKEIVTMLQSDPKVKAAMTAKPKAKSTKPVAPADPGAGAMGAMAGQLAKGGAAEPNTMANAPVSKTNTAKPGNPNAAPAAEPKPGMTQDDEPHWDPKTGKGAKYDGVTGKATPGWQAELDKKSAASAPPANPLADTPPSSKPAPTTAPTTTGKAAANADATGGDPEKAALDAMKSKNPKLAGMMAQAGMDDQGNDVPKKKGRQKAAPKPSQAEIDASRERIMGPTSDSIIRTRPMMAEGFSLFRKR